MPPKKEDNVDIQTTVKTLVSKICSSQDFIDQLSASLSTVIRNHLENRITRLEEENQTIQIQIKNHEQTIQLLNEKCDKMEQSLRCKAIRIYGIKESRGENIENVVLDVLNKKGDRNKVKYKLSNVENWQIEKCFRLGKLQKNKNRPIFVTFVRQMLKNQVYNNKKMYKGTGIVIREDLTSGNLKLLKLAVQMFSDAGKVWTNYGRVYVKINDREDIHLINTNNDLNKIII